MTLKQAKRDRWTDTKHRCSNRQMSAVDDRRGRKMSTVSMLHTDTLRNHFSKSYSTLKGTLKGYSLYVHEITHTPPQQSIRVVVEPKEEHTVVRGVRCSGERVKQTK